MIKVAMIGVSGVLLAVLLKQQKNEYALYISLGVAVCILLLAVNRLGIVVETVGRLGKYIQIDGSFVRLLLKMLGITYVAEFASNICKDAGYQTIARQIEIFGKLAIMVLSFPVLLAILDTIRKVLS